MGLVNTKTARHITRPTKPLNPTRDTALPSFPNHKRVWESHLGQHLAQQNLEQNPTIVCCLEPTLETTTTAFCSFASADTMHVFTPQTRKACHIPVENANVTYTPLDQVSHPNARVCLTAKPWLGGNARDSYDAWMRLGISTPGSKGLHLVGGPNDSDSPPCVFYRVPR